MKHGPIARTARGAQAALIRELGATSIAAAACRAATAISGPQ
jgi:hypothetical protein